MAEDATVETSPGPLIEIGFTLLVFSLGVALAWELIVDDYNVTNICARAAAEPQTAFRDVLRECRLDEWGKQKPLTPAEERALREEAEE